MSEQVTTDLPGIDPRFADQQLNDKVGIEFVETGKERVVATMPVDGNLQPYGLLHGGANAVLAEAAGSVVAALSVWPERIAVGTELSCTHHRGVREGKVTATAVPLHVGRSSVSVDIVLTDDSGRRTCTARLTCAVITPPSGK